MNTSNLRRRYQRILMFFAGVILNFIFWELILRKIGFRQYVRRTRRARYRKVAVRFRMLALDMGGVMIKVGQFLSSRLDILPPEVTETLAGLQDEVPAEDFEDIRALAEQELGTTLAESFEYFDTVPLAAASLGQVHRARLRADGGEDFVNVVVKVQRPAIGSVVEVDLFALKRVGGWLMAYRPIRDHADIPALLREFSTTVQQEIDYIQEAAHAEAFFRNFKSDKRVNVPRVVRRLSTLRVLTLEDVYAIKITDYEALNAAGIDRSAVARKLARVYLKQVFEDGFFHADPHPGNLFITPLAVKEGSKKPTPWQLTFVDFGMVGHVPENLRAALRETVIAMGTRDAGRLIRSYKALGFLLPNADVKALEHASEAVFERFWGMSMRELRHVESKEVFEIGHRVRDVMLETPFQVPNDLLMLARTAAILSGMCTGLDEDFNVWEEVAPYAEKMLKEEVSSELELDSLLEKAGEVVTALIAMPSQASRLLARLEAGELVVQIPRATDDMRALSRAVDRLTGALIFGALLVGGVLWLNAGGVWQGRGLLFGAGITLLWVLLAGNGKNHS